MPYRPIVLTVTLRSYWLFAKVPCPQPIHHTHGKSTYRPSQISVLAAAAIASATTPADSPPGNPRPESIVTTESASAVRLYGKQSIESDAGSLYVPLPMCPPLEQQQQQLGKCLWPSPPMLPISGLILLDPADGSFEPQDPNRFPSALSALRDPPAGLADVPVLVVGAGRGGDCVPRMKNFRTFFQACRGMPCVLVSVRAVPCGVLVSARGDAGRGWWAAGGEVGRVKYALSR